MRIKFSFSVLILLFSFGLFANEYSPGSEIGDAVFRPLSVYDPAGPGWCTIGHTALYRNSKSVGDWDPFTNIINSDMNHSVIQATGEGAVVGWQTFKTFLNGLLQTDTLGYTSSNRPNTVTRLKLIQHAKDQYGAAYPQKFNEWYYPKIMTPGYYDSTGHWVDGCFRCDGLVEYVYEQENMGFFTENEKYHCWFYYQHPWQWLGFPKFYPEALRERMTSEGRYLPYLEIVEPQNGDTIEAQVPIHFVTDDGPDGSGIDRVDILIDSELKYRDDEDCDGAKEVNYIWNTLGVNAGLHRIVVKTYGV